MSIPPVHISGWDSELSNCTSDEEEDTPPPPPPPPRKTASTSRPPVESSKTKATRRSTQEATQRSKSRVEKVRSPGLRAQRNVTYSVASLFEWMMTDLVDLNPEYQRGVVWNDQKQSVLIDSVQKNFPIPPLILTVIHDADGGEKRICIDGKQRMTSIKRFLLGEIPHKDPITHRKTYGAQVEGQKRRVHPAAWLQLFRNKQIPCVEYDDLTDEQERDIFQRVQMGVALSPLDRLPAANGPYADLIRELRQKISRVQFVEQCIHKEKSKVFQALAKLVFLFHSGTTPAKCEPTPSRLEVWLSSTCREAGQKALAALRENALNVVEILSRHMQDSNLNKVFKSGLTQIEFVMAGYIIYLYRKRVDDDQVSDFINRMRKDVQAKFSEIKFNKDIFNHMFAFVKGLSNQMPVFKPSVTAFDTPFELQDDEMDVASDVEEDVKVSKKRKRSQPEDDDPCMAGSDIVTSIKRSPKRPKAESAEPAKKPSLNVAPAGTASRARTLIKRAPGKAIDTQAVAKPSKPQLDGMQQVGRPSVKPPPSSRVGGKSSKSSIASGSSSRRVTTPVPVQQRAEYTPPTPISAGPRQGPSSSRFSANSRPHPPLPGRDRSTASASSSPRIPASTDGVILPPSYGSTDRLAAMRHAKAMISNRSSSVSASGSVASVENALIGQGVGTERRNKLPSFTKNKPVPEAIVDDDSDWVDQFEVLRKSIPVSPPVRSAPQTRTLGSAFQTTARMVSSQVLVPPGPSPSGGIRSAQGGSPTASGTGTLATPFATPSPTINSPQGPGPGQVQRTPHPQTQPLGSVSGNVAIHASRQIVTDPRKKPGFLPGALPAQTVPVTTPANTAPVNNPTSAIAIPRQSLPLIENDASGGRNRGERSTSRDPRRTGLSPRHPAVWSAASRPGDSYHNRG